MACFAGPSYTEIQIEKESFLPIKLNIRSNQIDLLSSSGQLYQSVGAVAASKPVKACNASSLSLSFFREITKWRKWEDKASNGAALSLRGFANDGINWERSTTLHVKSRH